MGKEWTIADFVSSEVNIDPDVSLAIVNLFEDGHEIPFIARYRRHLTHDATPDELRHVLKAFNEAKALKAKAEKYIQRIDSEVQAPEYQKKNLKCALSMTMDDTELENLMAPFKKKRNTLAAIAADLGVGPICEKIMRGERIEFADYVDRSRAGLEAKAKVEKAVLDYMSCDFHRMETTQTLLQKIIAEPTKYRVQFRVASKLTTKGKQKKKAYEEASKKKVPIEDAPDSYTRFKLYDGFNREYSQVKDHQVLALERAALKGVMSWDVTIDNKLDHMHPALLTPVHRDHSGFLKQVVADSVNRFFKPAIQRTIRRRLLEKSESSAIDCFASNLRELLMTAPLKGRPVLAVDPGFAAGCKCALIDEYGKLIDTAILRPKQIGSQWKLDRNAESLFISLVSKCSSSDVIVAVGNGTGSQLVEKVVTSLIERRAFGSKNVEFCIISECGSSVYSASELAEAEFPQLDITLRSAVSIARRVIDPISEYVKIAPKHLGVGSYQHSVKEKRLDEMLDLVVRECVSNVGVDVNVASQQVLQKVAGLNKRTAENILKYRDEHGRIPDRETLKTIKGIGPKTFEQCAGFLFIFDDGEKPLVASVKRRRLMIKGSNPLDSTPVHPESYSVAERIVSMLNADLSAVATEEFRMKLSASKYQFQNSEVEKLVCELLCKPTMTCNPPKLFKETRKIGPILPGSVVEGVVMNHTQFGSFIDIGIGFNGLLHASCYTNQKPPEVNSRILVKVYKVDMEAKRVSLHFALNCR